VGSDLVLSIRTFVLQKMSSLAIEAHSFRDKHPHMCELHFDLSSQVKDTVTARLLFSSASEKFISWLVSS
jgi:hypothetical protein